MIVTRYVGIGKVLRWSGHHVVWLLGGAGIISFLYHAGIIAFSLPWLPISVIGTAVAFYVGFKNNNSYDRMWEARKIWGAIVNSSRDWGMRVDGLITNQFATTKRSPQALMDIKRRLVYRHIAWLYALRHQLLATQSWEHTNQGGHMGRTAKYYQENFGIGLVRDEIASIDLGQYVDAQELARLQGSANLAVQLVNEQSRDLSSLREADVIDDFRHMELLEVLSQLYDHQGRCERIKKFPIPRQYANMSRAFVSIFIMLLPFSMIPELIKLGPWGWIVAIPVTALIGWVYVMMEVVGDYSEYPFLGMANDIPMLSMCRGIEIDMRQMLGEKDLPPAIQPKNDVLM